MTGSAGAGNYADMYKRIPFIRAGRQGIEWVVWISHFHCDFWMDLIMQTADKGLYFEVRLAGSTGDVYVYDRDAGSVKVGAVGGALNATTPLYLNCKMVADYDTDRYAYIRVNDAVFDASDYRGDTEAAAWPGRTTISPICSTADADPAICYLDDVIFTIDEP